MPGKNLVREAVDKFRRRGGLLRTKEALEAGIHPRTLYRMRDQGIIESISHGVHRLAELPPVSDLDLVVVATRVPRGVICLISALSFQELTTQIPNAVDIALQRGAESPRLAHPPLNIYRFGGSSFTEGIEEQEMDGVRLRMYCPEKTLADCFKFRNRVGLDVCIEAINEYRRAGNIDSERLLYYARICRVERTMRPYLEALL